MLAYIFEILSAFVLGLIFIYLLVVGYRQDLRRQPGWRCLLIGFGLLTFGMVIDVTDNFPALSRFIFQGNTLAQTLLVDAACYLGGALFLAIGIKKWLPLGGVLRQTEDSLRRKNSQLETEISERVHAQEALQVFRKLIDRSNDALFVVDAKYGGFVDVNMKACQVLGYEWHELLRMKISDIEDRLPGQKKWLFHEHKVYDSGEMIIEARHKRKDGTTFPVEVSVKHTEINGRGLIIAISRDISERKIQETEKEKIFADLQHALENVKILSGFLPICSYCKNIRDDKGLWGQIEGYIKDHSEMDFTHSICPECAKKEYPDFNKSA